eukprot:TRINITY_DN4233_c0_g3_i1.p1 TRINITY_DN4233_c0_g3~~TRINITY_DN4233_c0_g3_i1.p1  ORF type:complete len:410 (-),score=60.26 TRINITY_DN4233_c0_g3_i1:17-1246(-)
MLSNLVDVTVQSKDFYWTEDTYLLYDYSLSIIDVASRIGYSDKDAVFNFAMELTKYFDINDGRFIRCMLQLCDLKNENGTYKLEDILFVSKLIRKHVHEVTSDNLRDNLQLCSHSMNIGEIDVPQYFISTADTYIKGYYDKIPSLSLSYGDMKVTYQFMIGDSTVKETIKEFIQSLKYKSDSTSESYWELLRSFAENEHDNIITKCDTYIKNCKEKYHKPENVAEAYLKCSELLSQMGYFLQSFVYAAEASHMVIDTNGTNLYALNLMVSNMMMVDAPKDLVEITLNRYEEIINTREYGNLHYGLFLQNKGKANYQYKLEDPIEPFQRSLEIFKTLDHPYSVSVMYEMGKVYESRGENEKALDYYNDAVKVLDSFKYAPLLSKYDVNKEKLVDRIDHMSNAIDKGEVIV